MAMTQGEPVWSTRNREARIYCGDASQILRYLSSGSIQCCVTSPPYWGLRDYGTSQWIGGDADCDHRKKNPETDQRTSTLGPGGRGLSIDNAAYQHGKAFRDVCGKCGAVRIDRQLGLEKTPEEYVAKMVDVFREVRRVLRDDGTLWLNLGDSYSNASGGTTGGQGATSQRAGRQNVASQRRSCLVDALKPKDLVGIPWRVAFALQSDGWYLRQDIIWHKPNPMPESVTDRCTKSHEYIFLLAKSARYYYDADAIREPSEGTDPRLKRAPSEVANGAMRNNDMERLGTTRGKTNQPCCNPLGRNRRSVWTVSTKPYSGAHFATFPPDLIEPCILAGCPEGGVVLDPFNGSGTTGAVCIKHGRQYVGLELNPEYIELSKQRIGESERKFSMPLFSEMPKGNP